MEGKKFLARVQNSISTLSDVFSYIQELKVKLKNTVWYHESALNYYLDFYSYMFWSDFQIF